MNKKLIKSVAAAGVLATALAGAAGVSAQAFDRYYSPESGSLVTWDYAQWPAERITATATTTDTKVEVSTSVPRLARIPHSIEIQTLCSDGNWVTKMADTNQDVQSFSQSTECPAGTVIEKSDVQVVLRADR